MRARRLLLLLLLPGLGLAHAGLTADVARLTRELETAPTARTWLRRAEKLRLLGRVDEALADVASARVAGASPVEVEAALGLARWAGGDARGALEAFDRHLASGGAAVPVLRARAEALESLGRGEEATLDLARALALSPQPDGYLELARLQERLGRPADAQATLEQGLERLGGAVTLRLAVIGLCRRTGQLGVALGHARAAAQGQPVPTQWQLLAAEVLLAQGRPREARAELEAALATVDALLAARSSALLREARAQAVSLLAQASRAGKVVAR